MSALMTFICGSHGTSNSSQRAGAPAASWRLILKVMGGFVDFSAMIVSLRLVRRRDGLRLTRRIVVRERRLLLRVVALAQLHERDVDRIVDVDGLAAERVVERANELDLAACALAAAPLDQ